MYSVESLIIVLRAILIEMIPKTFLKLTSLLPETNYKILERVLDNTQLITVYLKIFKTFTVSLNGS
jgi:hypothetical protein